MGSNGGERESFVLAFGVARVNNYALDVYARRIFVKGRTRRKVLLTEGGREKKETKERERKMEKELTFFYIYFFIKIYTYDTFRSLFGL